MRFVDYDPAAAATAAASCREAADELRGRAELLRTHAGTHLAAWEGASRITFGVAARELAEDLRAEAGALDATADAIDAATAHARRLEADRRGEHEAEQARRAERETAP
jgi:uncharacterized protein YukE